MLEALSFMVYKRHISMIMTWSFPFRRKVRFWCWVLRCLSHTTAGNADFRIYKQVLDRWLWGLTLRRWPSNALSEWYNIVPLKLSQKYEYCTQKTIMKEKKIEIFGLTCWIDIWKIKLFPFEIVSRFWISCKKIHDKW